MINTSLGTSLSLLLVVGLVACSGDDDKKSTSSQGDAGSQAEAGAQGGGLSLTEAFDALLAAVCDRQIQCDSAPIERQKCIDEAAARVADERKATEGKDSPCTRAEFDKCVADYKALPCDGGDVEPPCECIPK
ncbi:MAG: hypothetical protein KF850_20830 [Labilithrix sp.]|nr:hypothetical protein [Labilithrix sp.]MBX3214494.1 hypothetical protein [Labilithrix sp.]